MSSTRRRKGASLPKPGPVSSPSMEDGPIPDTMYFPDDAVSIDDDDGFRPSRSYYRPNNPNSLFSHHPRSTFDYLPMHNLPSSPQTPREKVLTILIAIGVIGLFIIIGSSVDTCDRPPHPALARPSYDYGYKQAYLENGTLIEYIDFGDVKHVLHTSPETASFLKHYSSPAKKQAAIMNKYTRAGGQEWRRVRANVTGAFGIVYRGTGFVLKEKGSPEFTWAKWEKGGKPRWVGDRVPEWDFLVV